MKRVFFATICAAAMLATSCEKSFDDVVSGGDKAATLSVSIGLPEMSTRAFADGRTATELQYAVYEKTDDGLRKIDSEDYCGTEKMVLSTDLSFTLLKDHTYGLVFWAAAPSEEDEQGFKSPYEVEFGESGATMKYGSNSPRTNSDKMDAFYAYKEVKVTGDSKITAQLHRPFAQINIGTNDFEKAQKLGLTPPYSSIKVEMNNVLDLVTGETSLEGRGKEVAFLYGSLPEEKDGLFPVQGYDYLAMAYVLVGLDRETINVGFAYDGTSDYHMIGSVPVQRNYRTNIYGALLTNNLDVNVEIEPGTGGDHEVMLKWDGETLTEPAYEDKTYTVVGADELAWLASQPDKSYEGDTIVLESDLDLAGHEFTAFASGAQRSGNGLTSNSTSFKGVFDGNGKTIRGFTAKAVSDKSEAAAFISNISGEAVVKDVTFENVEIVSDKAEQAGIVGLVSGGATVENVKVMGGTISSAEAAGGIVGRILGKGEVKDCENHANVSTTAHNAGGIVGAAYYNNDGMSITDCDNYGTVSGKYAVGGIVGLNCGDISGCNNYGTSVTGQAASVGGVVGEQKGSGKITGCTNKADVSGGEGSTNNYGCGGIVGWVRYTTEPAYTQQSAIVVSGCINEGKHIKGASGVGGIVGAWYCDGECKENTNMAETITANGSFAAGIVGNSQWTEVDSKGGSKDAHTEGLKLTVHDNVSYTAKSDIQAGGDNKTTHLYVYINDSSRTTETDNSNPTMTTVGSAEDFKSAFAEIKDGDMIVLSNGSFDCKTVTWPTNGAAITIKGKGEESKLTNLGYENTDGCDLTLENLNLFVEQGGSSTSFGFQNANSVTLKNVKVMGEFHTFSAKSAVFEGCHFVHDGVNTADRQGLWCDGYGKTVVKDCIFEVVPPNQGGNETKAILIFSTTNFEMGDVEVTNCTFKKGLTSAKACVEIHSENFTKAGTVTITGCTWDEETYRGGLWREIYNGAGNDVIQKGDPTKFYTVYVDGQLKQEGTDSKN